MSRRCPGSPESGRLRESQCRALSMVVQSERSICNDTVRTGCRCPTDWRQFQGSKAPQWKGPLLHIIGSAAHRPTTKGLIKETQSIPADRGNGLLTTFSQEPNSLAHLKEHQLMSCKLSLCFKQVRQCQLFSAAVSQQVPIFPEARQISAFRKTSSSCKAAQKSIQLFYFTENIKILYINLIYHDVCRLLSFLQVAFNVTQEHWGHVLEFFWVWGVLFVAMKVFFSPVFFKWRLSILFRQWSLQKGSSNVNHEWILCVNVPEREFGLELSISKIPAHRFLRCDRFATKMKFIDKLKQRNQTLWIGSCKFGRRIILADHMASAFAIMWIYSRWHQEL